MIPTFAQSEIIDLGSSPADSIPESTDITSFETEPQFQPLGSPLILSNNTGTSASPQIAASSNATYVVWTDNSTGNYDILFTTSADGGATFGNVTNLSNNTGNSFDPKILLFQDIPSIVWTDNSTGNYEVLISNAPLNEQPSGFDFGFGNMTDEFGFNDTGFGTGDFGSSDFDTSTFPGDTTDSTFPESSDPSSGSGTDTTPPGTPTALSPSNNEILNSKKPEFDWTDVSDPSTPVTYNLYVDDNQDFSSPLIQENSLSDSKYETSTPMADGVYYWAVSATDAAGNEGELSSAASLKIDSTPPPAPTLLSPPNEKSSLGKLTKPITKNVIVIDWTDVSDPSTPVTYNLYVDDNQDFSSPLIQENSLSDSKFSIKGKLSNGVYYWAVSATDAQGNTGAQSTKFKFTKQSESILKEQGNDQTTSRSSSGKPLDSTSSSSSTSSPDSNDGLPAKKSSSSDPSVDKSQKGTFVEPS
jgi:hypothetical protein